MKAQDTNPHTYEHPIFYKEARNTQCTWEISLTNGASLTGFYMQKKGDSTIFVIPNKTPGQVIQKPHLNPFLLNLTEEKLGNSLEWIDRGDYFLNKTLIVQALR